MNALDLVDALPFDNQLVLDADTTSLSTIDRNILGPYGQSRLELGGYTAVTYGFHRNQAALWQMATPFGNGNFSWDGSVWASTIVSSRAELGSLMLSQKSAGLGFLTVNGSCF